MNNYAWLRIAPFLIGLLVILGMAARGCRQGPFGRPQVVQLAPEEEAALGAQAYAKILSQSRVVERGAVVDDVKDVGRRLAGASTEPRFRREVRLGREQHFDWEFRVIADRQVNAFCLPGGKVAVFTGIVPVAQTDAGLAVVMGHEIGHALARHGAERIAQQQMVRVGQVAVATSLGGLDPYQQRAIFGLLGAGSQYGILLPFSRKHESEADHIGLLLMATAGYDPREAPRFWERMERASGGKGPPEFNSTHPSHGTRIRDLQSWMPEALALYDRSDKARDRTLPPIGEPSRPRPEPLRTEPAPSGMKGKGYEFK